MSIRSRIAKIFKRSTSSNPSQWFVDWVRGGQPTSSGASVNEKTAMEYSPFWAAVRVISGTLAFLPFLVYKREGNDKIRQPQHRNWELLHNRPNTYIDSVTFREVLQSHALTYGNGYAEIQRDGGGRPVALWPLLPDQTWRRIGDDGLPFYEVRTPPGQTVLLLDENVLHIKGLGFDGYTGYNVVHFMRETIGYGIAVKQYAGRFFSGDATPGGVLEHPQNLSEKALKNLYDSWNSRHTGLSSNSRLQILEEGMKYTPIGVNPSDAQSLEVQKYTVDDCARIFNIPPHKLASMDKATFSNIEEQNLDFISSTMMYWFRKWEQECDFKLFTTTERNSFFCEILADGLLRGKAEQRNKGYAAARQWGWLSVNDIRRLENMNSIGQEGDTYLEPLNMKPAGEEIEPDTPPTDPNRMIYMPRPTIHHDAETVVRTMEKLIADSFQRVVNKFQKCGHTDGSLQWAIDRMIPAIDVIASLRGISEERAHEVLTEIATEYVCDSVVLIPAHAFIVAKRILQQLGVKQYEIREKDNREEDDSSS